MKTLNPKLETLNKLKIQITKIPNKFLKYVLSFEFCVLDLFRI